MEDAQAKFDEAVAELTEVFLIFELSKNNSDHFRHGQKPLKKLEIQLLCS